jgi:hypothetical protein
MRIATDEERSANTKMETRPAHSRARPGVVKAASSKRGAAGKPPRKTVPTKSTARGSPKAQSKAH